MNEMEDAPEKWLHKNTTKHEKSSTKMNIDKDLLQLATFICPSISVDYCEMLGAYIEAQLGIRTTLLYDSRRSGPNTVKGDDRFIDVAFIGTTTYVEEFSSPNSQYKLLPVGGVFQHPTKGETLGYYTDIILSRDTSERVKEFLDLRGCAFAYSQESSISTAKQVLVMLKQMGENASFFSDVKAAGNHIQAIEMVLAKKVECAAVGSVAFAQFLKKHHYLAPQVVLKESWGPLPPHPIIVNKNLPDEIVSAIEKILLRMHKTPGWSEELKAFGFDRFQNISPDTFINAKELLRNTRSLALGVTYY